MGGNSPSKDKAPKSETNKNRSQNSSQHKKMYPPGNTQQGIWTTTPTLFVGTPAQAYAYNKPKSSDQRMGQRLLPNGVHGGRHFASEPILNHKKAHHVQQTANHHGRKVPQQIKSKGTPVAKVKSKAKPKPFIVEKLGPPPRHHEVQGGEVTLNSETIKLEKSHNVEDSTSLKRKTATARIFSGYQMEQAEQGQNMPNNNAMPEKSHAGQSVFIAKAYSDYSDSKGKDSMGIANQTVHTDSSSKTSHSPAISNDNLGYVHSDSNISYNIEECYIPTGTGYTRVSQDQLPNSGYRDYTFIKNRYNHGVFIAQPMDDAESLTSENKEAYMVESKKDDMSSHSNITDPIYDRVMPTAQQVGGRPIKRSVSDVTALKPLSSNFNKEPIYAHVNKDLKRHSSQKQYNLEQSVGLGKTGYTPEQEQYNHKLTAPPSESIESSQAVSETKQRTSQAVLLHKAKLMEERQQTEKGRHFSISSDQGHYASVGKTVAEDAFRFLEEFDDNLSQIVDDN